MMSLKLPNILKNNYKHLRLFLSVYGGYFFVFLATLLLFVWLESDATFADPDSFYHAKIAVLIKDQGIVKNFIWLPLTILKNYYVDQHLLYHLLLAPFVSLFSPLIGLKIATVFFAVFLFLVFYWWLRQFNIRHTLIYTFILLASSPFVFRIGLAKASAPAITVFLLGLYFIFKKKYWFLAGLSFLYVWLHGGFILILIAAGFYALAQMIIKPPRWQFWRFGLKEYYRPLKPFLVALAGVATGMVVNPYFPQNVYFYWLHIFEIGLVNYQGTIGVGAEWYPYLPLELIGAATFVFILLLAAVILFATNLKKQTVEGWTLFLLTAALFLLTVKSRRQVEYFIPIAILFSVWIINQWLKNFSLKEMFLLVKKFFQPWRLVGVTLAVYFILTFSFISFRGLTAIKGQYADGLPFGRFAALSEWSQQNIPAGEIVFHSDWDDFPILFYYNSQNYYISGLDPTFMYKYNPEAYRLYSAITKGEQKVDLNSLIKNNFKANYAAVGKDHWDLANNLNNTVGAVKVYEDKEGWIYYLP